MSEQRVLGAVKEVFEGKNAEFHQAVSSGIVASYRQHPRHYHTLRHIGEMLELTERFDPENRKAFLAAILYHDIIYDPHRYAPGFQGDSNEKASADICRQALSEAGLDKVIIERAEKLILWTQKHDAPSDDEEAKLFMDIDMAIVGSPPARYQEYCVATAKEFLTVFTPEQYLAGRSAFLTATKDKKPVFKTAHFADREDQAAQNMAWELANIGAVVAMASTVGSPALHPPII